MFAYVSDPLTYPHWNSAVATVRKTSSGEDGVGSTYLMERELPTGRAILNGMPPARIELAHAV